MTESVFTAICGAIERKRNSGKAPLIVTMTELCRELDGSCSVTDIRSALKELHGAKRVKIGRTINDHYITTC